MKAALSERTIFYLSIIGLLFSVSVNAFSIYNLSKNVTPTYYIFIFGDSLFFALGILYYLFKKNGREARQNNYSIFHSYRSNKILLISFYIVAILILIIVRESIYIKPLSYYLLISLATVIIGVQIISKQEPDKKQDYAILFLQIIPLAIIIRGSSFLINPYLIGRDVPWHFYNIQRLVGDGYLDPSASHYYYYPSYHLTQSMDGLILGFSESSFNLINVSISVVSIIIAYQIGKEAFNNGKIGLMCSLLLTITTLHIFLVNYNTSKVGGVTLLILCLLLLLKRFKFHNTKTIALFWMSAAPLLLWHPDVSFALMLIVGGFILSYIFIKKRVELISVFALYLIAFIAHLLYVHIYLFESITSILFTVDKTLTTPILIQSFAGHTITIGVLFQLFMAYLGITLPIFFVMYISLKWLHKLNEINLFFIFSLLLLHLVPFFEIFSGKFALNPARALIYVSIFLAFIAACGIFKMFTFKNRSNIAFFIVLLFIFSFFSVSSYLISDRNDVFNDEIPLDVIDTTQSNVASHTFLRRVPSGSTISMDHNTRSMGIINPKPYNPLPDLQAINFPRFDENSYIVINPYNMERMKLELDREINIELHNKLYDNYKVMVYKKPFL